MESTTDPSNPLSNHIQGVFSAGNRLAVDFELVAGFSVQRCDMSFHYGVSEGKIDRSVDHFYLAEYLFESTNHELVYDTLNRKLTELYGEGVEERTVNVVQIKTKTWTGANDTFVSLYCGSESADTSYDPRSGVFLAYGRKSDEAALEQIQAILSCETLQEGVDHDQLSSQSADISGL